MNTRVKNLECEVVVKGESNVTLCVIQTESANVLSALETIRWRLARELPRHEWRKVRIELINRE